MMDDDPRIDPTDLRGVRFPGSRRRYEAPAVDQFLASLVERIVRTNALVDDLRRRAEVAEAASAQPASPFDEPDLSALSDDELVALVGSETAHVLSTARRAADDIKAKAEEAAARLIREATTEAQQATAAAEERAAALMAEATAARDTAVADATAEADELRARTAEEIEALLASARERAAAIGAEAEATRAEAEADAERIRDQARDDGRAMVNEAKAVRGRILDDLQRRRDLARTQIQTLLAGRARLLAAYERVRADLDLATSELEAAGPALDDAEAEAANDALVASLGVDADDDAAVATDAEGSDDEGSAGEGSDGPAETDEPEVDTAPAAVAEEPPPAPTSSDTGDAAADEAVDATEIDPTAGALADEPVVDTAPGDTDAGPDDDGPPADPPAPEAADAADPDTAAAADAAEGDEDDEVEPGAESPERDVDALFARIRAERAESVARAQRVLSGAADPTADETVTDGTVTDDQPVPSTDPEPAAAPADTALADTGTPAPGAEVPPASAAADAVAEAAREALADEPVDEPADEPAADVAVADVDAVPAELLAPADARQRRQAAIDELDARLSRALKRQLADEQNEVLDTLRRTETTVADDLLPAADAHVAGYAGVALPLLASAARAGSAAAVVDDADADTDTDTDVDVSTLATQLAAGLVEPFRRRIERAASEVDGDPDALDERLRAVYREWKVSHIGAATTDALLSAYAQGQLAATPPGATVQWRIDHAQGPCPDAQDNALAGSLPAGEAFPTGDACPQAHPGCRCLLVVDT